MSKLLSSLRLLLYVVQYAHKHVGVCQVCGFSMSLTIADSCPLGQQFCAALKLEASDLEIQTAYLFVAMSRLVSMAGWAVRLPTVGNSM